MRAPTTLFASAVLLIACGGEADPTGTSEPPGGETGGTPAVQPCTPGAKECVANTKRQCGAGGQWGAAVPCPAGTVCAGGVCAPCQPTHRICQGAQVLECDASGTSATPISVCPEECYNGVCVTCKPGTKTCRDGVGGAEETWECVAISADAADWQRTAVCSGGAECTLGLCINPCQPDIKLSTNQGCDYYALDLENTPQAGPDGGLSAADAQFAVIVSNPRSKPMTVTVHETQQSAAFVVAELGPGELQVIPLGPRNIAGTTRGALAWRLVGTAPFVAYQFNPLDNKNPVFSNDASLLLPVNAMGSDYMVMTASGGGAFLTVVATRDQTEVTLIPSAPTQAGVGIPGLAEGESWTTTLEKAGEVLNVRAADNPAVAQTLTGSIVSASRSVAVFGGNVLANTGGRCCADHLEQQMFPMSAWGTTYVATKARPRGVEADHWRILARDDNTTVELSGSVSQSAQLGRGQFMDVDATGDFVVVADKPILVGQFLASSFEILPVGEYCDFHSDCLSGICSGGGSGGGVCLKSCQGAAAGCAGNEVCIANVLLDRTGAGGACLPRPCGAGLKACPSGASCANLESFKLCLQTCSGPGTCTNPTTGCAAGTDWGDVCAPYDCQTDIECPDGFCVEQTGQCRAGCQPQNECGAGSQCIPPGYVRDETIKVGLCTPASCTSDAECDAGHTCVLGSDDLTATCQPIGDPAFILAVPVAQFRDDYVFLAPNAYKEDYVNVIAPVGTAVLLDDTPVPPEDFVSIAGSSWVVARLAVADGAHRVTASAPVGVVVYGYDDDVSYGYPAGANLFDLGK